jgi:multiple sugar transport system substrate-binding protein
MPAITVKSRTLKLVAAATSVVLSAALTGCGSDDAGDATLTVWSLENLNDRVQATQKIVEAFTAETGIQVNVVPIDENQFAQLITSAAAAGTLPDVVGALPLTGVWQMAGNELVDTEAARSIVASLGENTFSPRTLELTRRGDAQLAVPSDGWTQLLVYRKDLFDQAGLPAPDTFDRIRQAARTLHTGGVAGITMATVPDDAFTAQTFENFALANGCELVDAAGTVKLNEQPCVDTFALYGELVRQYSVPGAQSVDSTRATYFAGQAAMMVWSSFILDEMAALRLDALPTCPQCAADPTYLAKNSGVVTAIRGPDGAAPAQFGELTSWVVTASAKTEQARRFVEYMMDKGYPQWLGIAPEGKFPARKGNKDDAEAFAKAWDAAPAGVDTKKPLGEVYPPEVLDALRNSPDTFQRWGITQGQGVLVGATLGELPVPKAVNALASGDLDPPGAADRAAGDVRSIQQSIR